MILQLDPDSPVPPYEQLRSQITTMVATGVLPQGARLPPIRQLARDLGVATATIARVFRELERDQIITTRGDTAPSSWTHLPRQPRQSATSAWRRPLTASRSRHANSTSIPSRRSTKPGKPWRPWSHAQATHDHRPNLTWLDPAGP